MCARQLAASSHPIPLGLPWRRLRRLQDRRDPERLSLQRQWADMALRPRREAEVRFAADEKVAPAQARRVEMKLTKVLLVSSFLAVGCKGGATGASRGDASPAPGGAAALAATPAQDIDVKAEGEKLMRISRAWAQTVAQGDFEAALEYWADDAVVMTPGQPPIRGKEAIRAYVEGASKIPGFRITWEPLEAHVSSSGDLAYLLERNEVSMNDAAGKPVTEHNKVVTVWRKQSDGSWKNVVDMWNASPTSR